MRNTTSPVDNSNQVIIAQLEPICPQCGGFYSVFLRRCLKCGCGASVMVWEYDAADVRSLIAGCQDPRTPAQMAADEQDAQHSETVESVRPY